MRKDETTRKARSRARTAVDTGAEKAVEILLSFAGDETLPVGDRIRAAAQVLAQADLEDDRDELQDLTIQFEAYVDHLTDAQKEALRNCPDGMKGLIDVSGPLPPLPELPRPDDWIKN